MGRGYPTRRESPLTEDVFRSANERIAEKASELRLLLSPSATTQAWRSGAGRRGSGRAHAWRQPVETLEPRFRLEPVEDLPRFRQ